MRALSRACLTQPAPAPYDRTAPVFRTGSIAPLGVVVLSACASSAQVGPTAGKPTTPQLSHLQRTVDEQAGRIAELEARLGLLEREARETRPSVATSGETIRIGKGPGRAPEPWIATSAEGAEPGVPAEVTAPPRLPVVALPDQRIGGGRESSAAVRERYRAALKLVREQRWEEALAALANFLTEHPHESISDNARYWRGEVYYALRRYPDAIQEFQGVLARFPASDKAADCLLKVGLCHLRLGDRAEASRYFEQVIEQFPKSDAARAASAEGPT
jgi:tol-pal system protein YbgF